MSEYFACADALLITLKKADIFSFTIPGKLQSYLACAKPIIGAIDGIGKEIIKDSKSGLYTNAENSVQLAKEILRLSKMSKSKLADFSKNALLYFNNNFAKEKLLLELEDILKK